LISPFKLFISWCSPPHLWNVSIVQQRLFVYYTYSRTQLYFT